MEVVNCHEHVFIEWGAFESQNWAVVTFAVVGFADKLTFSFLFFSLGDSFDVLGNCPVDKDEITFVGSSVEYGGCLVSMEENATDSEVDGLSGSLKLNSGDEGSPCKFLSH